MAPRERRERLDQVLVTRGLVTSRARARDVILRGLVSVEGVIATKPGQVVAASARLQVAEAATRWVSRGAEKLIAGLDAFGFDPSGRVALDIGASTGGFTEVLLDRGAARVYAVDVGHGQLHATLAANPRVVTLEGTDARGLTRAVVPDPITAIVCDVAFISVAKALPAALALAEPGAWLIVLVKPQFEVGRAAIGKGGIVREATARETALTAVADWVSAQGWSIAASVPSPIAGGDGNAEWLLGALRADHR
jgi:23S rRNA (cytidine1920-2'-O)/16S rRNA (cytidine1409-2'-O)-methyltransferase